MARLLISILFVVLLTTGLQAQVSGHRGGLFIVKTDLMSPLFDYGAQGGLEIVALRRLSFTIDYRYQNERINGNLANLGFGTGGYNDSEKMTSHTVMLGIRLYSNKALPAPHGAYWYLQGGIGRVNLQGTLQGYSRNAPLVNPPLESFDWTYGPMAAGIFEWGFGYQWIFFKHLTVDIGMGMTLSAVADNQLTIQPEQYGVDGAGFIELYDYYNKYGGNLYTMSAYQGLVVYGFSGHVGVGLLIP